MPTPQSAIVYPTDFFDLYTQYIRRGLEQNNPDAAMWALRYWKLYHHAITDWQARKIAEMIEESAESQNFGWSNLIQALRERAL